MALSNFKKFFDLIVTQAPLMLIVAIFASLAVLFITYNRDDVLQHMESCSTNVNMASPSVINRNDFIHITIEEGQGSRFKVSGSLFLKAETYAQLKKKDAEMTVVLDPLKSHYSFMPPPPIFLSFVNNKTINWFNNVVEIKISDAFIYSNANVSAFPFEEYRIGIVPNLYVSTSKDKVSKIYKLDGVVVNGYFPGAFIVNKAAVWGDFSKDEQMSAFERTIPYSAGECPLIIKRPFWYRALVVLLVLLLFVPSFYLAYKADNNPGLGLITSILEVATIRNFLLSGFDPWRFFAIDIIFAFAIILAAAIPLWSIYRGQLGNNCRQVNAKVKK